MIYQMSILEEAILKIWRSERLRFDRSHSPAIPPSNTTKPPKPPLLFTWPSDFYIDKDLDFFAFLMTLATVAFGFSAALATTAAFSVSTLAGVKFSP
jgi:hypothetical protein